MSVSSSLLKKSHLVFYLLSLVVLGDQWSENPWKSQGINLVVNEILEKSESLVTIFWESGKNRMESPFEEWHSHSVHFLLNLISKVTECANCLHPRHFINL